MKLEKQIIKDIKKFEKIAFDLNYFLANNPEISGKEYNSSKKIIEILRKNKIYVEENYCGLETAFLGKVVIKENSDINLGILAEYDALPEIGHACGHSASAAISVLAALLFKANEELIDANIDIIGTPDEENMGLKIPMAEKGAFDKYDSVIMVHLHTKNIPNWKFLAFETYDIQFIGKPSHAAAFPWEGRSALDGLMLSIHAIDMMRKCLKPQSIVEGFIVEGGVATNIIPEKASAKYTFRSNSSSYIKKELIPWLKDILEGCAKATQTKYNINPFGYQFSDMKYINSGTDEIRKIMQEYGMEVENSTEASGSSDIGNVSYKCPAFHPSIQITNKDIPLHTKEFAEIVKSKKSESCIINGAYIIIAFLSRLIENKELRKIIKNEFKC